MKGPDSNILFDAVLAAAPSGVAVRTDRSGEVCIDSPCYTVGFFYSPREHTLDVNFWPPNVKPRWALPVHNFIAAVHGSAREFDDLLDKVYTEQDLPVAVRAAFDGIRRLAPELLDCSGAPGGGVSEDNRVDTYVESSETCSLKPRG